MKSKTNRKTPKFLMVDQETVCCLFLNVQAQLVYSKRQNELKMFLNILPIFECTSEVWACELIVHLQKDIEKKMWEKREKTHRKNDPMGL